MTYKQIEASREVRLWITQVIIPTLGIATAVVMGVPELRQAALEKAKEITSKFKKHHK
jgi:hypothetical protein